MAKLLVYLNGKRSYVLVGATLGALLAAKTGVKLDGYFDGPR